MQLLALVAHHVHTTENAMRMEALQNASVKAALLEKRAARCALLSATGVVLATLTRLGIRSVHAATDGVDGNAKNPLAQKAAVTMVSVSTDHAFVMLSGPGKTAQRGGAHVIARGKALALARLCSSALANLASRAMIAARKFNASTTALNMGNAHCSTKKSLLLQNVYANTVMAVWTAPRRFA